MNVLALNSSPRVGHDSKTELMLDHLVQGLRQAGANVEVIGLHAKKIKPCLGCFSCWTKTPGCCIQGDDMSRELYSKFVQADLAILATPLYHYTLNSTMKAFIERTLAVTLPIVKTHHGQSYHPLRDRHPLIVALSVAGFPDESVFDQLSAYMRFLYGPALIAEIYRPAAELLPEAICQETSGLVLAATRQAGLELVQNKRIAPETMAAIKQPLADPADIKASANIWWQNCIDAGLTPAEFTAQKRPLKPYDLESLLTLLRLGFNPAAAGGMKATIQFYFSGQVEDSGHLVIEAGRLTTGQGSHPQPDLTIRAPFELWVGLMTGEVDGQQAFLEGKYTAEGNFDLLLALGTLFRS